MHDGDAQCANGPRLNKKSGKGFGDECEFEKQESFDDSLCVLSLRETTDLAKLFLSRM